MAPLSSEIGSIDINNITNSAVKYLAVNYKSLTNLPKERLNTSPCKYNHSIFVVIRNL